MHSSSKKEDAVSLVDGQSPLFMANLKVPLKVGHAYCHKDHPSKIFIMDNKDDTYAYLSSQDLVSGQKTDLEVGRQWDHGEAEGHQTERWLCY